jgi:hypothetical protein
MRVLAFLAGFVILFNFFVGAGSQSEGVVGGYGFRVSDFLALFLSFMLIFVADNRNKWISILWFGTAIGCSLFPILLMRDSQTATLIFHFLLYSAAGLYVAILLDRGLGEYFAWGMLTGLGVSVFTMLLVQLGVPVSTLSSLGLAAGYAVDFGGYVREMPRLSGLWGHPNEAAHVAALASAGAAYLLLVKHSKTAAVVGAVLLLGMFYFTLSRGGLLVGAGILMLSFVIQRGRSSKMLAVFALLAVFAVSEVPDIGSRLSDQADAEANAAERLDSMLAAAALVVSHPLGQSIVDFQHDLQRSTLVVVSPHNGFLFMGTVLGLLGLFIFCLALATHLMNPKSNVFMALLSLQVCASFMFEQISSNRSYVFVLGIILASAYLRTPIGAPLRSAPEYQPERSVPA